METCHATNGPKLFFLFFQKMSSDGELSKLLAVGPSMEGKFFQNTCLAIYREIVWGTKKTVELLVVKEAWEAYAAEEKWSWTSVFCLRIEVRICWQGRRGLNGAETDIVMPEPLMQKVTGIKQIWNWLASMFGYLCYGNSPLNRSVLCYSDCIWLETSIASCVGLCNWRVLHAIWRL